MHARRSSSSIASAMVELDTAVDEPARVGLVLGGGGVVGLGYHAAALTALENDLGWDARRAEVIVGTSAGSLVGAFLRRGLRPIDLAALIVGAPAPDAPRSNRV